MGRGGDWDLGLAGGHPRATGHAANSAHDSGLQTALRAPTRGGALEDPPWGWVVLKGVKEPQEPESVFNVLPLGRGGRWVGESPTPPPPICTLHDSRTLCGSYCGLTDSLTGSDCLTRRSFAGAPSWDPTKALQLLQQALSTQAGFQSEVPTWDEFRAVPRQPQSKPPVPDTFGPLQWFFRGQVFL